jgi:hypothetical protein
MTLYTTINLWCLLTLWCPLLAGLLLHKLLFWGFLGEWFQADNMDHGPWTFILLGLQAYSTASSIALLASHQLNWDIRYGSLQNSPPSWVIISGYLWTKLQYQWPDLFSLLVFLSEEIPDLYIWKTCKHAKRFSKEISACNIVVFPHLEDTPLLLFFLITSSLLLGT